MYRPISLRMFRSYIVPDHTLMKTLQNVSVERFIMYRGKRRSVLFRSRSSDNKYLINYPVNFIVYYWEALLVVIDATVCGDCHLWHYWWWWDVVVWWFMWCFMAYLLIILWIFETARLLPTPLLLRRTV